jgi:hypothetical protein
MPSKVAVAVAAGLAGFLSCAKRLVEAAGILIPKPTVAISASTAVRRANLEKFIVSQKKFVKKG